MRAALDYEPTNPKLRLWTKQGLTTLGQVIRDARLSQELSLDDVTDLVCLRTGVRLAKKTVGNVENNTGEPKYNTIAAIAESGFVKHPITGRRLTVDDFIDIACELSDPYADKTQFLRASAVTSREFSSSIADRIQEFLHRTNTSVDTLARQSGIMPPSRMDAIASGRANPTDAEVAQLAACEIFTRADGSQWSFRELAAIAGFDLNDKAPNPETEGCENSEEHRNGHNGITL